MLVILYNYSIVTGAEVIGAEVIIVLNIIILYFFNFGQP
jgi:hypothetical protein